MANTKLARIRLTDEMEADADAIRARLASEGYPDSFTDAVRLALRRTRLILALEVKPAAKPKPAPKSPKPRKAKS